ncbi:MAG: Ycf51 family protein [Cyanophyceae cyanobacterium]
MNIPPIDFAVLTQWSGILTISILVLTVIAFVFGWGIRFRLVGATGFMVVLTAGLFALGLGLFTRTVIPGAVRFARVYDNGANQVVIAVPPRMDESAVEATLRQAADDLYSRGRLGLGNKLTIRLRTIVHPEPGLSQPLYLGRVERSLSQREDKMMNVEVFADNVAQLPQVEE